MAPADAAVIIRATMRLLLLTTGVLLAFASNSLIGRMALGGGLADPASFTAIRIAAGAAVLVPLARAMGRRPVVGERVPTPGNWLSALALMTYAVAFSVAYVRVDTGMGALILFGAVQVTMLGSALLRGERQSAVQWLGTLAAFGGLVYLVLPGLDAPDALGATLMAISGVGWGVYSLRGRGATTPIAMTAGNFLRGAAIAVLLVPLSAQLFPLALRPAGLVLALVSGALTSGLGYALWYHVLPDLGTTRASVVQLTVPVLAGIAGVVVLDEAVTLRLALASVVILGGVAVAVVRRGSRTGPVVPAPLADPQARSAPGGRPQTRLTARDS